MTNGVTDSKYSHASKLKLECSKDVYLQGGCYCNSALFIFFLLIHLLIISPIHYLVFKMSRIILQSAGWCFTQLPKPQGYWIENDMKPKNVVQTNNSLFFCLINDFQFISARLHIHLVCFFLSQEFSLCVCMCVDCISIQCNRWSVNSYPSSEEVIE